MAIKFNNKRYLVVDDLKELREAVRSMLNLCGAREVDLAKDGSEAISLLRTNEYDIILCDYHLKEGKDGQQILEQARYENLIKQSAIFMIITAESAAEMVFGALEYQPDGYIVKPLNTAILKSRIEKALNVKDKLAPIYKEIEQMNYGKADTMIDAAIAGNKKFLLPGLQLKTDLYLQQARFEEAKKILVKLLKEHDLNWAKFALGKAEFGLTEYDGASVIFKEILAENPNFIPAYDWLADCLIELRNNREALEVLKRATTISPHAIKRQMKLGKLAEELKNTKLAEGCFREAVNLGRNSVYKSPENYTSLARSIVHNLSSDQDSNLKPGSEALDILSEARNEYRSVPDVYLETLVIESKTQHKLGQDIAAKKALTSAINNIGIAQNLSEQVKREMLECCKDLGEAEKIQMLRQHFKAISPDDTDLLSAADDMMAESQLNFEGMNLYYEKKYEEALKAFTKAAAQHPDNISINLNAAQAAVRVLEKKGHDDKVLRQCHTFLNAASHISKTDKSYSRYTELFKIYKSYATKN